MSCTFITPVLTQNLNILLRHLILRNFASRHVGNIDDG